MNKTQLINQLLSLRKGRKYLEIGFKERHFHFDKICCDYKVGVGPYPGATFHGSPDTFFHRNKEQFDIIFIDGDHEEEQVLKEINNALACVSPGGVIVIHDCDPPDAWHQREATEFNEGENWNGTVWKAALRFFNTLEYKCTLVDMDWGCAVIDTSQKQQPKLLQLPEKLTYEDHFPLLQAYKVSVAQYLRAFVKVFFHVACMHNWKQVFTEAMQQLRSNGFNGINLTLLGNDDDLLWVYFKAGELDMDINVIFHDTEFTNFERPAMLAIEEFAGKNEGFVLYLHSKGVSNPGDTTKAKWRRLMMRELVDKWEICVAQLPEYDIIGVNWREMQPVPHFCGNFWYASTRHIRKLADFRQYYDNPRFQLWDAFNNKRLGCEFWIGSYRDQPKVLSLYCKNVDFCNHAYWNNEN